MKSTHKFLYLFLISSAILACSDFGDTNIDPKNSASSDAAFLFTNATKTYSDWATNSDDNSNVGRLAAQYFSQVTYTNESRYDWTGRAIGRNIWGEIYASLNDLQEARRIVNEKEIDQKVLNNKTACISVMEVFIYQVLVDLFGDIPYSAALDASNNPSPAYEDAATIYSNLINRLDDAILSFDSSNEAFGTADPIYKGDVLAWKRFANGVKLRLAIRLADVNPTLAQELIEAAAGEAFMDNTDNALFHYLDGSANGNPLYATLVLSERHDYVPANTLVDYMNALNDPRRPLYMTLDLDNQRDYIGNRYGQMAAEQFEDYSQIHPNMQKPTFPGELMTFSEVAFILAEAAERGWNVGDTAKAWYNAAITASIMQWGGTMMDATDYLKNNDVAYGKAEAGDEMKTIALQKWIALYNNGYQGWIEWRRLDYPVLNAPENLSLADIPMRHTYPVNERAVNATNYEAAANAIGGDQLSTKLFWDVK